MVPSSQINEFFCRTERDLPGLAFNTCALDAFVLFLLYFICRLIFTRTEENIIKFNEIIDKVVKVHEDERVAILSTGSWPDLGSWGSISTLTNNAYLLSLIAVEQIHEGNNPREELASLNEGLLHLSPFMKEKSLAIIETETTLAINFTREELFENGTMEGTPNSLKYLPIIGALFNENPHSLHLLGKMVQACQVYHPVEIIRNLAFNFNVPAPDKSLPASMITSEMFRLESQATEMKFACYRLIIMYAECLALSQKPFLKEREPKHIAPAMPHFTTSLNLLQKKFMRAAELLKPKHHEL